MPYIEEESYDPEINPKIAVAIDMVVFSIRDNDLKVLLVQKDVWPFNGKWALPGCFSSPKESLEETAKRELFTQTGADNIVLEQSWVASSPDRDPRLRSISVSFLGMFCSDRFELPHLGDSVRLGWFSHRNLPDLSFDHGLIISNAYANLRQRLKYSNIAWCLLPREFTLTQLQTVYEIVSGKKLDKRNFRKKIHSLELLSPTKKKQKNTSHRPAELYKFKK
jgi:8-oxo-dGTP diphosphatase